MTRISHRAVVDQLARDRLLPFVMMVYRELVDPDVPLRPAWYLMAICYLLERAANGDDDARRIMIWLMPRTLKSIIMAVAYPCWLQGRNPHCNIMIATYSADLARQHAEHRRTIMTSIWYQRLFPKTRLKTKRQLEIVTTSGGRCRGVSVDGSITGKGSEFIILDDVMKADDAFSEAARLKVKRWFDGTMLTRRNNITSGVVISMQQRVHEDDLPAYLLTKGYHCLRLPAIADRDEHIPIGPGRTHFFKRGDLLDHVRFPKEALEQLRFEQGPQLFSAQYLQDPVSPEGNLVRIDHFRRYEEPIDRACFHKVVQSWDTAQSDLPTADWSVGTTWGYLAHRWFLLDIYRGRPSFSTLKALIIEKNRQWQADTVLIEYSNAGIGICNELCREGPFRPIAIKTKGNKTQRYVSQSGQIEEGRVFLPAQLNGLDLFLHELRAFPGGDHDDQVDTLTQLLEHGLNHWKALAEERLPNGRIKAAVRGPRPPLPPLPDWIR